jgi:GAF domain-containing protein/multidrug resistance efflux pump
VGRTDSSAVATPAFGIDPTQARVGDALHEVTLDLFASDDPGEIAGKLLGAAGQVLPVDGVSLWVPSVEGLECRAAIGEHRELLAGTTIPASTVGHAVDGEGGFAVLAAGVATGGRVAVVIRVTRARIADDGFTDAEQNAMRALADAAGAAITNATRLSESQRAAADSARDLALITEMSREITSTLDLDRVLRSVVNLASRAFEFDRGAIGLYEHGVCDIRAVAGADAVDPKDPGLQDLAVRAAWAAGLGEGFYLSDRSDPASDAERTFVQVFGEDLERDGAMSGLYLPLKDEEGIVGILLFETGRTEFATPRQRELASILANQATVAVRNARLYHQVPLADTLGALSARKEAFLGLPRQRRIAYVAVAVLGIAAATLIRWPLRVSGIDPVFRPLWRAEVRPTLPGVIDRVFIREGMAVDRGAPIMHLRDDQLRAQREAAAAAVAAADRSATIAASRGDAADERLQRVRGDVLRRETNLLDEQLGATLVRSPVRGVVLTARPEERLGTHADAGELLAVIGRTDSLELEFSVDQRDVTRVRLKDEVRLRVAALPQQTFSGRVTSIAAIAAIASIVANGDASATFPVRAVVANDRALLRPGMTAYARVLTEPASLVWRVAREPVRAFRLLWWRLWS